MSRAFIVIVAYMLFADMSPETVDFVNVSDGMLTLEAVKLLHVKFPEKLPFPTHPIPPLVNNSEPVYGVVDGVFPFIMTTLSISQLLELVKLPVFMVLLIKIG